MPTEINVTVYCASATPADPCYMADARAVGSLLAQRGATLVTGAGNMGLMGAVNDAAIAAGGRTVGVIPRFMVERGWHHAGLTELRVTDSMHSRKELMASMAHGVIALPGGVGTLEELMEIITWRQLGLYHGNIVILNTSGYYDHLLAMLGEAVSRGFLRADHSALWSVADTPGRAVELALAPVVDPALSPKF